MAGAPSAIACLVANFQNYILNNSWTYADRSHKGFRKLEGYFSYLLVSAAGLGVTTGLYAGFVRTLASTSLMQTGNGSHLLLAQLGCQFVAVLAGDLDQFQTEQSIALAGICPPEIITASKQGSFSALF